MSSVLDEPKEKSNIHVKSSLGTDKHSRSQCAVCCVMCVPFQLAFHLHTACEQ